MENVFYSFNVLNDNDIVNETENYLDNIRLIKDLFEETDSLRHIEINDDSDVNLVLFNEDDEYILIHKEDYDKNDFEWAIRGNKYYIFHWITSYWNSDWSLDEIEILGE